MGRKGLTIIELLVSIGIIGLLMAILIPAVQYARESSRRAQCQNNLKQHGIAIANYESVHGYFPSGSNMRRVLMPYLESMWVESVFQEATRLGDPILAARHIEDRFRGHRFPVLLCPSDPAPQIFNGQGAASYAGNFGAGLLRYGYNGFFTQNPSENPALWPSLPVNGASVTNGLSQTVAMSEWLHSDLTMARLRVKWQTARQYTDPAEYDALAIVCDSIPADPVAYGWLGINAFHGLPWYVSYPGDSLYNHILTPNRPTCLNVDSSADGVVTAGSQHAQGVNCVFGDGHVQFVSQEIDLLVWRKMGSRTDRVVSTP